MPVLTQATHGRLVLSIYDFAFPGDELALHTHTAANNHITVVARGSFVAFGEGWQRTLNQGDVVDWPDGDTHGFRALGEGARLVNIVK